MEYNALYSALGRWRNETQDNRKYTAISLAMLRIKRISKTPCIDVYDQKFITPYFAGVSRWQK